MPSASTSTLRIFKRVEIVLVPFDRRAPVHARIGERHDLVEPRLRDDEAARVLREMARKTGKLAGEFDRTREARLARIEPGTARFTLSSTRPAA